MQKRSSHKYKATFYTVLMWILSAIPERQRSEKQSEIDVGIYKCIKPLCEWTLFD